jgi:hypothetical protein
MVLKKLLQLWLKYLSTVTYKLDDHIATALGYINFHDPENFNSSQPLCSYILILDRKMSADIHK